MQVDLHGRFEASLASSVDYENALQDVEVAVEFEQSGTVVGGSAFWDGERLWRIRFSPESEGRWTWKTRCSNTSDSGLDAQSGAFDCIASSLPGPLRVSASGTYFERSNGTPFFWLGDTAWNGPLKASAHDWEGFLADRAEKGFNVIQFVATQWISAAADAEGRPAYLGGERIRIEPAFFKRLDQRIDAINGAGMVAAPVLAWAAAWNADTVHLNPGSTLRDEQLVRLVRYLVSRYGAHQTVWILAGDGIYEGQEAERWRRIGRSALADGRRLATIHPGGKLWVDGEFNGETWFSFNGYQSGHWNDDDNCRWINEGPPAREWSREPLHPHVNLEPCYEGHRSMAASRLIDAHDVRRACYWSLLAAPPAGVTYGAHGIWSWESYPELPLSHPNTGVAPAWRDAIRLPGSSQMAVLKRIFESVEWWRLRPCQEMLATQPGHLHPAKFIGAARSAERDLAIVYLPEGGVPGFVPGSIRSGLSMVSIDPATGAVDAGGAGDRVLVIGG